jgi:hypothetical protein
LDLRLAQIFPETSDKGLLAALRARWYEGIKGALRMRILRAAAMLAVLLIGPALAQQAKPPAPQDPPKTPGELEAEKANNSAYKRSLGNIPDKPPADPWGGARAVEAPSSTTTTTPAKRTKTSGSAN